MYIFVCVYLCYSDKFDINVFSYIDNSVNCLHIIEYIL